ncbi:hypothetical protein [Nonomuraea indica]|uniref:Uncharacterized protein n=1 Tax=Nonomuraea indica TaxID=1581193 RepID=A0ABW8A317_9ACTN
MGGRAYSAYWNVNGTNRMGFAADGEMVFSFDGRRRQVAPEAATSCRVG